MKTDVEIQKDVIDELKWEPILKQSEINVMVSNSVVILSGYVNTFYKKSVAENIAWRVNGVSAVSEELEVRLAYCLTDAEIADSIARTFKGHVAIPDENVNIKVTNGWVTLEGEVDWNFQKQFVFTAVSTLRCIKGISNMIKVTPGVNKLLLKTVLAGRWGEMQPAIGL
jgi:osmotically-inducible protein OsmY